MKKRMQFFIFCLTLILFTFQAVSAEDTPQALTVNQPVTCGDLTITLAAAPVMGVSQSKILADDDLSFLVLKLKVENKGTETWSGFDPDSFSVQDVFGIPDKLPDSIYNTYPMDFILSGKSSSDFGIQTYKDPILPGATSNMMAAFEVYPDMETWNLIIAPCTRDNPEPICNMSFRLPKITRQ